ncbi:hypothetical protein P152DRAFT_289884 [Eremomyces bilateralis CBS 781.70]|uniref:Uncharacterized protein n=1 Tax=Eremomyces bilateralis CBS 781.70 TaxID=1392243 RepID=A0A6G1G6Q9_9PEZI|nr:uncharacterized protein P152DRAFT_289884 [Eremomyces bilateralis CBS 781.70]KAF1813733.1 hypothetical protein P152DRAFT_289884 [Eremomyces bilateralis CBS 781.70]
MSPAAVATPATESRLEGLDDDGLINGGIAPLTVLLSVAIHGTRVVYSDYHGIVRWMERDGIHRVRAFEIPYVWVDSDTSDPSDEEYKTADFIQTITPTVNPSMAFDHAASSKHGERGVDMSNLLVLTNKRNVGMLSFGIREFDETARTRKVG